MNNEKIEVGDVVEITQRKYPDAVMKGRVEFVDSDGDVDLEGYGTYITVGLEPERYNVKIIEKVKRKHRVGDAYQDEKNPSTRFLVCVGEDRWVYTDSQGYWININTNLAELHISAEPLKLTQGGPTNDEL